ncbi:MAG: S41 family peptidase [Steroidobacteraceae bacterium]
MPHFALPSTAPPSRFAPHVRAFFAALGAATLSACGCGGDATCGRLPPANGFPCSEAQIKQFVFETTRDWYLFPELLPPSVDPAQFATAEELLDALTATARAQGKDRFFSELTTVSADDQFFGAGTAILFGITLSPQSGNTRLRVAQVFENSPAADAGFVRGDQITAIGTTAATLEPVATILARPRGVTDALGPNQLDVSRVFRVLTPAGATVDRTIAKRSVPLNPVAEVRLIERAGLSPIGYIRLRAFVTTAEDPLRAAFAQMRAQNVEDIVLDLRYNGGGLLSTADALLDLLSANRSGLVSYQTRFNAGRTTNDTTLRFRDQPQAIAATRVAFITTDLTASASELVINALAPYADVAIVGATTFGKPVAQAAFDLSSCGLRLRLVSFKLLNKDGGGDFYNGIPYAGYTDAFCAAPDDLAIAQGAPNEPLIQTAIQWINTNACPPVALPGVDAAVVRKLERPASPLQQYAPETY